MHLQFPVAADQQIEVIKVSLAFAKVRITKREGETLPVEVLLLLLPCPVIPPVLPQPGNSNSEWDRG